MTILGPNGGKSVILDRQLDKVKIVIGAGESSTAETDFFSTHFIPTVNVIEKTVKTELFPFSEASFGSLLRIGPVLTISECRRSIHKLKL